MQPIGGRAFSMLAALDRSLYLAMNVLMNQVLNQSPIGPKAFTNGGIMAYTGPCRRKGWSFGSSVVNRRQQTAETAGKSSAATQEST